MKKFLNAKFFYLLIFLISSIILLTAYYIEYVLNEAQELETPIILAKLSTEETMEKLEAISKYSSLNHKEKLITFSSMMESSVDLSNIVDLNN